MILILTTTDTKSTALKIGEILLKQRLIACYNLTAIESAYRWEKKIVKSKEYLLILKTQNKHFPKIELIIKKSSSYEVPEIVAIKADDINKDYLNWLISETK